jgi:hypothetical protein
MRRLIETTALLVLMSASLTALAQPLTFRDIPDAIQGKWAATASACAAPALVVSPVQPRGLRFVFTAPIKLDDVMLDRPPPPKIVGSPDPVLVTFTPKAKPANDTAPQSDPDIDVRMPSRNQLLVKVRADGKQTHYIRCSEAAVG